LKSSRSGVSFLEKETPMPAVARIDPKSVFTPEQWRHLTSRSSWRGLWLAAHAWGTIAACIALVALWPNPLTWLVAGWWSARASLGWRS
jgi:fatty acid desaturase